MKIKKILFDYHSPIDYNPFGGGFKPKGYWVLNKQKLFNLIVTIALSTITILLIVLI